MTSSTSRRTTLRLLSAVTAMAVSTAFSAYAQVGSKPLRIIVPLTTGSTVDTVARAMSVELAKSMGQPVVIENLPGAGGVTGTAQLVRAPKDGQTLAMISSNHAINPSIYKNVPFDSVKDITPISVFGTVPLVLVVNTSVAAKNTHALVALVKASPGKLNYGSAGNGSVLHLAGELFKEQAGAFITHIPYRGTGPLTTDLMGGQVDMAFLSVTAAAPHIKSGKLRAIGVSTRTRTAVLPDVPTLAESGLPGYSFDAWLAIIAPGGTPKPIVQDLYQKFRTALANKDVQSNLQAQGITILEGTPEQAEPFFVSELAKHAKLVKLSGAVAE
ncbi:MAG: transporter substrate-binding protein [Polaromonas sp.]|nr:transporter substrate-binding protein [Polaromonas sp.]